MEREHRGRGMCDIGGHIKCLLCVAVCFLLLGGRPLWLLAAEKIDTERLGSLTVSFKQGTEPVSGVMYHIYRAADISETGELTLTGEFADYPAELELTDSSAWRALAETLAGYAVRDRLRPTQSRETDENGEAVFQELEPGFYLILGEAFIQDDIFYSILPVMIGLPGEGPQGEWNYQLQIQAKYRAHKVGGRPVKRYVEKIWADSDNEQGKRPAQIEVELFCDGESYDTAILSAEGSWRCEWENLEADHVWQVVEKTVSPDYKVRTETLGSRFVITNTLQEPKTPEEPGGPGKPDDPDNPDSPDSPDNPDGSDNPDNPDSPDNPDGSDNPDSPDVPDNSERSTTPGKGDAANTPENTPGAGDGDGTPDGPGAGENGRNIQEGSGQGDTQAESDIIPQTGTLWWLVPILAAAGLFCLVAGALSSERESPPEHKEKDES